MRTGETTTPAGTHDHPMPRWVARNDVAACVLLVILATVDAFLVIYIVGRGQLREQQIEQVREQIRESWCQALDGLPEGNAYLDLLRDKYHCGPGLPLSSFSPDEQAKLHPPSVPPSVPAQQPDDAPVPPVEPPPAPVQPPAADTPAPLPGGADGPPASSAPPPLSPPSQVRQLVCDLLPICPKETS